MEQVMYRRDPEGSVALSPQYAALLQDEWIVAYDGTPFGVGHVQVIQDDHQARVQIPVATHSRELFARVRIEE